MGQERARDARAPGRDGMACRFGRLPPRVVESLPEGRGAQSATVEETEMYALLVWLQVKPEHLDEYLKATVDGDAKGSVGNEPGCYRFDVIQDQNDPNTIYFYEVYQGQGGLPGPHRGPALCSSGATR